MSVYAPFGYVHVAISFVLCLAAFIIAVFVPKARNNALINSIALALTSAGYLTIVGLDDVYAAWARWIVYALVKALVVYSIATVFGHTLTRSFMVSGITFTFNLMGALVYFLAPLHVRWFMFAGAGTFLLMSILLIIFNDDLKLIVKFWHLIHVALYALSTIAIGIVLATGSPLANVLGFPAQTIAYSVLDIFAIYGAIIFNIILMSPALDLLKKFGRDLPFASNNI